MIHDTTKIISNGGGVIAKTKLGCSFQKKKKWLVGRQKQQTDYTMFTGKENLQVGLAFKLRNMQFIFAI